MISEYELANIITGATRAEGGVARKSSATILGKAVEDSESGMVRVVPEGDVFAPDGDNTIIIPTSPSVRAGDTVQIGLVGGVSKRPMVVAAGGEGDRQDSAIASAAQAAQVAWDYADSAHTAANQAKTAAQNAEADAARAEEAAQQAVEDAATAKDAAEQAVEDAGTAYTAAQNAQTSANNAATAAQNAQASATAANTAAQEAKADATTAKNSAAQANTAANSALTQLSVIEDVAGTLDWISKHGTYTLTSDTTVQEGTVYFEKVGNDYIPIAEPEGNPHAQGWYTLDVTDSQSDYIMAHLAVTSAGLWVLPSGIGSASDEQHAAGYKTLLSSTGMTIYDDTGRAVATYGEGIVFDSNRELTIGNNNAYIEYYDSNGDEVADSLRISANSITLGGSDIADTYATKDEAATMGEGSGESVTVDSGSRLRSLEVEGKSVQDGTPTPSSPVPIQVVGGANMIPPAYYAATRTASGITVTNNGDGTFTLNGTATATADLYLTASNLAANVIPIIANKEYRLLGMPSDNGVARTNVRLTARVRKADESGNAVYPNDYGLSATFTTTMACYVQAIYVNVTSGAVLTNLTIKPQIAQSSVTEYVPYGSLGLQVRGTNLVDLTYAKQSNNGLTFTYNSDGSIHVQGTANNTWAAIIERGTGYSITAPAGSYTISLDEPCTSANIYVRADVNGAANYDALINKTGIKTTATYSSSPTFCALVLSGLTNGRAYDFTFRVMFCAGSTALPYTPYVDSLTEIPLAGHVLASLPDGTKDVLSVDTSGHVALTKRAERVLVNGSETWTTIKTNLYEMSLTNKTANGVTGSSSNQMCSHFRIANAEGVTNPAAWVYTSGSSTKLRVGGSGLTSLGITDAASFKTWAASNPFVFYYKLATVQTVDLGYITMPELADGCTVEVLASLTPTFSAGWYTENGAALADFATKSELQVTADGITSTVEANYTSKDEFAANKSVRFKLLRDSWTDSQWATPETVGYTTVWSNYHIDSAGQHPATGYDISTLHVGDLIVVEGTSTDSKAPHSLLLKVNAVPSSTATTVNCTTVTSVTSKQLATRISQTESEISLQAKRIEEAANMLLDADAPSITKVHAAQNRYWSDTSNTMITCSFASLSDPPEIGIENAAEFVCSGTQTARKGRGLRFYNGSGNLIPLVAGQTYTASWWARCTEGIGQTCSYMSDSSKSGSLIQSDFVDLTTAWTRVTATFTPVSFGASAYCYFHAFFPANTAGKIQLCGFKLVAGDSAENVSAELFVQADKIAMVVDDSTTSSSLVLTSQAMDYIGDHVEIKGTDGTTTVISGGQIQTGSLTIGAMSSSTQADILNSNIEVGGTNLLQGTNKGKSNWAQASGNGSYGALEDVDGVGVRYTINTQATNYCVFQFNGSDGSAAARNIIAKGGEFTVSFDIRPSVDIPASSTAGSPFRFVNGDATNVQINFGRPPDLPANVWTHIELTATSTGAAASAQHFYWNFKAPVGTYDFKNLKLERGNKATDWNPAPDDDANACRAIYGTCSTAAGTAAKAVTCANFELFTGARIAVKFGIGNTAAAPTLNVNGTGAKAIWYNNAVTSSTNPALWGAFATLTFVYDGTEWVLDEKPPSYSISCTTAAGTQVKSADRIGALVVNGTTLTFNFTKANTYVAKAVQINLSSTGATNIYYNNAVTSSSNTLRWAANTSLTFVRQGAGWYLTDNGMRKNITQIDDDGITIHAANSPTLNYQLLNADGSEIFKGGKSVAKFSDTVRLGQPNGRSTLTLDYHSWQMTDKNGNVYGYVSDLRDSSGVATLREMYLGDGSTKTFSVVGVPMETPTVTVGGTAVTPTWTSGSKSITLATAPVFAAEVIIQYRSEDSSLKAYTFGTRSSNGNVGAMSFAEGRYNRADGGYSHVEGCDNSALSIYSHAEGFGTSTSGFAAHAEGSGTSAKGSGSHAQNAGTIASSSFQTALGKNNKEDTADKYAVIVGNGVSSSSGNRSDALELDWKGNVYLAGKTAHIGETVGADIAITKVYNSYGFRCENAVFHATADMVVLPLQFASDSSIEFGFGNSTYVAATIPAAYAPKEMVRAVIFTTSDWSSVQIGWANIGTDGKIYLQAARSVVWFGQAVWIRK